MDEIITPLEVVNEDGTPIGFEFPKNPLKEKWDKLYPPTQRYESREYCEGYACLFCGKCPYGALWEIPEEDQELWYEYKRQIYEYDQIHNPSLAKLSKEDMKVNLNITKVEKHKSKFDFEDEYEEL